MKILVVGGNGTIGKSLVSHFKKDNEIIIAGRTSGDFLVDITDSTSIKSMFEKVGKLDAIICTAGEAKWDNFSDLTEEDYYIGFKSKLMGQVNLVRIGQNYLNDSGSITLTTGILADYPEIKTASAAMVNGAIHSFVKAVALELENKIRINVVSTSLVQDAYEKYKDYFPNGKIIPMTRVAKAYAQSIKGKDHGQIIRIYE